MPVVAGVQPLSMLEASLLKLERLAGLASAPLSAGTGGGGASDVPRETQLQGLEAAVTRLEQLATQRADGMLAAPAVAAATVPSPSPVVGDARPEVLVTPTRVEVESPRRGVLQSLGEVLSDSMKRLSSAIFSADDEADSADAAALEGFVARLEACAGIQTTAATSGDVSAGKPGPEAIAALEAMLVRLERVAGTAG